MGNTMIAREHMTDSDAIATIRPRLFSIAYRMMGSVSEAEDVVQEALLRHQRALSDGAEIESPAAYLSTVVTRVAIDELRSARARRETYVGNWFPDPILTDDADSDPAEIAERDESLSMAFLLLLERLGPVERAVFLLHDVFGYGFEEIAAIVGKSEANCRQLAARARRHIEAGKPRFEASRTKRTELATRFFDAVTDGNLDGLVEMLATDAVVYGDGGGKAPAWTRPITGADRVARLFAGLGAQIREYRARVELREVNGQPGALVRDSDGRLVSVFTLDIVDGRVQTVRSVINPDKLRHLGPLADLLEIRRASVRRPRDT
jgi:RNA polymerase sigma-70 factor (ECF subfamily)